MLPRPDSQSFTKFLVTAGAFLIVAAFVVPGLILRDTDVLTISEEKINHLTPVAKKEIEHRQEVAHDAGTVAPWLTVGFLLAGLALIAFGVPRLWRQEVATDERSRVELDKLRREVSPQSPIERESRIRAEAEEDLENETGETADTGGEPPAQEPEPLRAETPPVGEEPFFSDAVRTRARLERQILARLAKLGGGPYEVQPQVKVGDSDSILLDALLVSKVDQLPDIVVEIKFIGKGRVEHISRRMREAEELLLRYMSRFRRDSIGWLILLSTEELPASALEQISRSADRIEDVFFVSIVTPETIDELVLPISA